MRQTISGLVAAFAVVTVSAAPALACGGGLFTSACSPCAQTYASPCGGYASTGYGYGASAYQQLPDTEQYYYVNQGPVYSGPGEFAPTPTYQERAVSGWSGYGTGYRYTGGRYASATSHDYAGAPAWRGPASYSYRPRTHFRPWRAHTGYYGYTPRRYGYAPRHYGYMPRHYGYAPRHYGYGMPHNMRYGTPRGYGHQMPLRRYY